MTPEYIKAEFDKLNMLHADLRAKQIATDLILSELCTAVQALSRAQAELTKQLTDTQD
jgi:hypothetical protein